jgi:hypothetical protein
VAEEGAVKTESKENVMGVLLAILAVVLIVVTGGSRETTIAKQQAEDPPLRTVQQAEPADESNRPATLAETPAARQSTSEQLQIARTDTPVAEPQEDVVAAAPNPCVAADGSMVPNCATIAKRTGEYVLAEQQRVINQWIHVWNR